MKNKEFISDFRSSKRFGKKSVSSEELVHEVLGKELKGAISSRIKKEDTKLNQKREAYLESKVTVQFVGDQNLIATSNRAAIRELIHHLKSRKDWNPDNLLLIHCKQQQIHLVFKLNFLAHEQLNNFKTKVEELLSDLIIINDHFFTRQSMTYWNIIVSNTSD